MNARKLMDFFRQVVGTAIELTKDENNPTLCSFYDYDEGGVIIRHILIGKDGGPVRRYEVTIKEII